MCAAPSSNEYSEWTCKCAVVFTGPAIASILDRKSAVTFVTRKCFLAVSVVGSGLRSGGAFERGSGDDHANHHDPKDESNALGAALPGRGDDVVAGLALADCPSDATECFVRD